LTYITTSDSSLSIGRSKSTIAAFTEESSGSESCFKLQKYQNLHLILDISCNSDRFLIVLDRFISAIPENFELASLVILPIIGYKETCNFSEQQQQLFLDRIAEICQKISFVTTLHLMNLNMLFSNNVQKKNPNLKIKIPIHMNTRIPSITECSQVRVILKPVNGKKAVDCLYFGTSQDLENTTIKTLEKFTCTKINHCGTLEKNPRELMKKIVKISKNPHVRKLLKKLLNDTEK